MVILAPKLWGCSLTSRYGDKYLLAVEKDIRTLKEELYGSNIPADELRTTLKKAAKKDKSIQTHYEEMKTIEGCSVSGALVDVDKLKKTTESASMDDGGLAQGTLFGIFVNSNPPASSQEAVFKELFEIGEGGVKKKGKTNKVLLTPSVYICLQSLCEAGKVEHLPLLIDYAEQIFKAHKKLCTATIISAEPLDKSQVADLKKVMETYLSPGEVLSVETKVDDSLVAGFKMEMHEKTLYWDLSAKTKLIELDQSIDSWASSASWQM